MTLHAVIATPGPLEVAETWPASLVLDGGASFDDSSPWAPLSYQWSQVSGPTLTLTNADQARCRLSSNTLEATDVVVVRLTVSRGAASAYTQATLTAVDPDTSLTFTLGVPEGTHVLPEGGWTLPVTLTGSQAALAAFDPSRISCLASAGGTSAVMETRVRQVAADYIEIDIAGVANGQRELELVTERLKPDRDGKDYPVVHLLHPAAALDSVLWVHSGSNLEPIPVPWVLHEPGKQEVRFARELSDEAHLDYIEVTYYREVLQTGWWAHDLKLGPYAQIPGQIRVRYGPAGLFNVETDASVSVVFAGRLAVIPHYDVWLRQGRHALLREAYTGVLFE
jgi:hypothetical protein